MHEASYYSPNFSILPSIHTKNVILSIIYLQVVFGTDYGKIWDAQSLNITLPPGDSNPFSYIVTKVFTGSNEVSLSFYPPWMHVCIEICSHGFCTSKRLNPRSLPECAS